MITTLPNVNIKKLFFWIKLLELCFRHNINYSNVNRNIFLFCNINYVFYPNHSKLSNLLIYY